MKVKARQPLKFLGWIMLSILVLLIIICASVFIQIKTNPDKVPSIFGFKPFIVLSDSIETKLSKGDLVVVKDIDPTGLKENDIVAFRDEEGYVIVRHISEIDGEKITIKDNNNLTVINQTNIEGKYAYKLNGFGNLVLVMQEPLTLFILLLIILIIGTLWIIFRNNKL